MFMNLRPWLNAAKKMSGREGATRKHRCYTKSPDRCNPVQAAFADGRMLTADGYFITCMRDQS